LGLNFAAVNYYDGQGFMAKKSLGVKSAHELDGASVCVQAGTTTELNLADFFRGNGMSYNPVVFENNDEVLKAYESGRCDVLTTDQSGLYSTRVKLGGNIDDHVVLPEIISKEPLGPAVRQGDDEWNDIVRWTLFAMIQAEEFDLTAENVDKVKAETQNPDIQRFLGVIEEKGPELKLPQDFAVQIIKQVGNYGESFDRNLGPNSPLKIERGQNALWTDGGLMYNPPFR
jgi:general L-amino acid transport system substrate-binding protein